MKSNFKPLGMAAAVAVASASYAGLANAQTPIFDTLAPEVSAPVSSSELGDLALVPYYTVNGEWITGVHIVNTSASTQVVKVRFRRASDSLDALDFNIVMSPYDVYAGFLSDDENGTISWKADDTTCTVPAADKLIMPEIYREGAETGYVEIIAMGQPIDEDERIAVAAKHKAGVPGDCVAVRSNFFADGDDGVPGQLAHDATYQAASTALKLSEGVNEYVDSENALKVSYFIRDNATGIEFGDNAVIIEDFLGEAAITNQEFGVLSGDLDGFDFPDLDGGVPTEGTDSYRGRYNALRQSNSLGVAALINEWTANTANGAALSWVVTIPGQYTMLNMPEYLASLDSATLKCDRGAAGVEDCDNRDIPVEALISAYDREEGTPEDAEGELVVSPSPPGVTPRLILPQETNVITFGGAEVLGVSDVDVNAGLDQPYGWLALAVNSAADYLTTKPGVSALCFWNDLEADAGDQSAFEGTQLTQVCDSTSTAGTVPMIGFAAWARNVAANPNASYGRIVEHSVLRSGG